MSLNYIISGITAAKMVAKASSGPAKLCVKLFRIDKTSDSKVWHRIPRAGPWHCLEYTCLCFTALMLEPEQVKLASAQADISHPELKVQGVNSRYPPLRSIPTQQNVHSRSSIP